jgi:hypothetical protein
MEMTDTLENIRGMTCSCCTEETNLTHTQHVFEGYRDFVLHGVGDADCPYPQRSCRAASWGHGVILAMEDHDAAGVW